VVNSIQYNMHVHPEMCEYLIALEKYSNIILKRAIILMIPEITFFFFNIGIGG